MEHRTNNARVLAALIAAAGLMLMIYSLMAFQSGAGASGEHGGMMGGSTGFRYYTLTNMFMAMVGAMMFASGAIFVAMWRPYGTAPFPRTPFWEPGPYVRHEETPTVLYEQRGPGPASTGGNGMAAPSSALTNPPEAAETASTYQVPEMESSLVLRLLNGDERTVFRTIKESGGEVLQRDIVLTTKMSEAKVSRVLDRLVEKGLVVKERNGMGNKVRIQIDV